MRRTQILAIRSSNYSTRLVSDALKWKRWPCKFKKWRIKTANSTTKSTRSSTIRPHNTRRRLSTCLGRTQSKVAREDAVNGSNSLESRITAIRGYAKLLMTNA